MSFWWLGFSPAQATVTCGESTHRLRWETGTLEAIDHDDLEAESALAALGGQRCTCVEVIDAWRRHHADPRVLVLASRGPADRIAAQGDWTTQLAVVPRAAATARPSSPPAQAVQRKMLGIRTRRRTTSPTPQWAGRPSPVQPPPSQITLQSQAESELVALLGLGGGLQDRLVATVAAAWAERFADPHRALDGALPTLQASMQGRLSAAVRSWLGRGDVEVKLEMIDSRQAPSLTESGSAIHAELPFDWLSEVWSRGLAIVLGRFCLAARTDDGRAWTLTTVGPDLGSPRPVRVEMP